ncbi:MAG: hypothetical protein Q4D42_13355, partial [Eubacteriales bacterium]|nr:hypothetical protein [Eubacteriales bacterium]
MRKQLLSVLLTLAMCLTMLPVTTLAVNGGADDPDNEAMWQTVEGGEWQYGTFAQARSGVYEGGTIKLLKDVGTSSSITFSSKDITLESADPDHPCTLYRSSGIDYLISITSHKTLTLAHII